jgi:hypothetical protein
MLKGKLTHRRTINSNTERATSGGCNIMNGDIVERLKQLSKPYPKMRRKRRHRCARLPVWRGRGSTERGAPIMSHIGMPARSAELFFSKKYSSF